MNNPPNQTANHASSASVDELLKQATLEIRRLRSELDASQAVAGYGQGKEPIAIVGMGCCFPGGVSSPEEFWQLLAEGRDAIIPVPNDRWRVEDYPDSMVAGGFLDDVRGFDAGFFGISPREAEVLDPQQRLLLEVSYRAVEHAGLAMDQLRGSRTGVFVGICFDDYAQRNVRSGDIDRINAHSALGNNRSIAAGRISYTYDFRGPVVQLDTTCSSSLVCLHLACSNLQNNECDMALAGGVNLMLSPEAGIGFNRLQALSSDGRCRTFDDAASGYSRGEGCGMLVLKRLADAQKDGDRILALVRGSALNHDGASNGLTAPSGPAQTDVIKTALRSGGLVADQVQYVEAHGTATPLGDPIEVQSLANAHSDRKEPLLIGSVKTNIGHLESAAGVAGIIKSILSIQHAAIPAHLHFKQPSSRIAWDRLPLKVAAELTPWPDTHGQPRRAGISSFGMSGTNAHVVIEQALNSEPNDTHQDTFPNAMASPSSELPVFLFPLSAKTPQALVETTKAYLEWLRETNEPLRDIAYSMALGRSHYAYRSAFAATNKTALLEQVTSWLDQCDECELAAARTAPRVHLLIANIEPTEQEDLLLRYEQWLKIPAFTDGLVSCEQAVSSLMPALPNGWLRAQLNSVGQGNVGAQSVQSKILAFAVRYAMAVVLQKLGLGIVEYDAKGSGCWLAAALRQDIALQEAFNGYLQQRDCDYSEKPVTTNTVGPDAVVVLGQWESETSTYVFALEQHGCVPACQYQRVLQILASLYGSGLKPNWPVLYRKTDYHRAALPVYPFQRKSYWQTPTSSKEGSASWPGNPLVLNGDTLRVFNTDLASAPVQWSHHKVAGEPLFPAAGYVSLLQRLSGLVCFNGFAIKNLKLNTAFWLQQGGERLQSQWKRTPECWHVTFLFDDTQLAQAEVIPFNAEEGGVKNAPLLKEAFSQQAITTQISGLEIYQQYRARGIDYGVDFQLLEAVHLGDEFALAQISINKLAPLGELNAVSPILLDTGLQLAGAFLAQQKGNWLPGEIEGFLWNDRVCEMAADSSHSLTICVQLKSAQTFSIQWCLGNALLAEMSDLRLYPADGLNPSSVNQDAPFYEIFWPAEALAPMGELVDAEALEASMSATLNALPRNGNVVQSMALQPHLETFSQWHIKASLMHMGWAKSVAAQSFEQLCIELNVVPEQRMLFKRLLIQLAQNQNVDVAHQECWWQSLTLQAEPKPMGFSQFDTAMAECEVVQRCALALPDVLNGKADPLQLLFPDGDLSLLTRLYEKSPGAQVMNGLVSQTLEQLIQSWPKERPLRVLEVGAGTGGTTAHILPMLAGSGLLVEYLFTDLSPHFLQQAQQRFAKFDFIQYQLLDLEAELQLEHLQDVVVASNVLHATKDIQNTLQQIKRHLAPQGALIMLEATQPLLWLDLVFGMMPGWWVFDDQVRKDHPLLTSQQWQSLLFDMNYHAVSVMQPKPALPQSVIVARTPALEKQWLFVSDQNQSDSNPLFNALRFDPAGANRASIVLVETLPEQPQAADAIVWQIPTRDETLELAEQVSYLNQALLRCVQQLARWPVSPRLWLVTTETDEETTLLLSTLWGWVQTLQLEYPNLRCSILQADDAEQIAHELLADAEDRHIRVIDNERRVARLQMAKAIDNPLNRYQLVKDETNTLDGIGWESTGEVEPGPGEVCIRVEAAGLNFRDVLIALGQYPEPGELGAECCGVVTAVGSGVTQYQPGDGVMAIANNGFDSQVVVDQRLVSPVPTGIAMEDAATLPVAYVTAAYGLLTLADLKPQQRVLIHNASGGVGLAAIQIAKAMGAFVFATASAAKQSYVRDLGVQHVYDSRTTDFVQPILEATNGKGVDVVLSALPKPFQKASLQAMQPNGVFIDIGKGESLTDQAFFEMAQGVVLHRLDLVALCEQNPNQIQSELKRLVDKIDNGDWVALPKTTYAHTHIVDAFRQMQQARHIGKLVITRQQLNTIPIHHDKTYLITGGLGGLGLLVTAWLIEQGARHLCLTGRTADSNDDCLEPIRQLCEKSGAVLRVESLDVTHKQQLHHVIEQIQVSGAPLAGVIHAAGVLDDALIGNMSPQQLQSVLAPKVQGAWLLHELTQSLNLDCFVVFSSAAGVMGAPGQANHASANSFLDGLIRYRRNQGLPGLSLAWGAWSGVGSALKYQQGEGVNGMPGVGTISPEEGIGMLATLWQHNYSNVAVLPIDWSLCLQEPRLTKQALFKALKRASFVVEDSNTTHHQGLRALLAKTPADQRLSELQNHLAGSVSRALGMNQNDLDREMGLFDLGLDSLTALELKNRLQQDLGLELPTTMIFDYPNTNALAGFLWRQISPHLSESPTANTAIASSTEQHSDTAQLIVAHSSEAFATQFDQRLDEVEALLTQWDVIDAIDGHENNAARKRADHAG